MALKPYVPLVEFDGVVNHSYRTYVDPGPAPPPDPEPEPEPEPVCEIETRLMTIQNPVHIKFLDPGFNLWSGDRDGPWTAATVSTPYDSSVGIYTVVIPGGPKGRMNISFSGAEAADPAESLHWATGNFMSVNQNIGLHVAVQSRATYALEIAGPATPFRAYFMGYMIYGFGAPFPSAMVGIEEAQPWFFSPSTRGERRFVWVYNGTTLRLWAKDPGGSEFDAIIGDNISDVTEDYEGEITLNNIFESNGLPSSTTQVGFGADFFVQCETPGAFTVTLKCTNLGLEYLCEPIPE